jgi:phosphatidylserine decarboxylase
VRFARYARTEVWGIALAGLAATLVCGWWFQGWAVVPAAVSLALLAFYRDPPRRIPQRDDVLLAPADGRVLEVVRNHVPDEGAGNLGPQLRILIFLSVLDVHINRTPCGGRIVRTAYRPGRFHNAMRSAASALNEQNTIELEPAGPLLGPVVMRQIAGVLARRIVCAVREGDRVSAGQQVGMIKLGSQTELRVPESDRWRDVVTVGAHVRAGESILARLDRRDAADGDAAEGLS